MAEATRIYIHSTAREEQKRKAITAAGHMRHTTVHELVFPLEPFPKSVTTIGVVGGDGSARAVGRKILEEESDRTLLVFPGGSENGFYNCLVAENTVLRADDLLANDYENVPFFHPGERNGEFFFHIAGTGTVIEKHKAFNEKLRDSKIPRGLRSHVSAIATGFSEAHHGIDQPLLNVVAIGQSIGRFQILPDQSLYDNKLTMITIEHVSKIEFIRLISQLSIQFILKKSITDILTTETAKEFIVTDRMQHILSGNALEASESVVFKRSEKSIRAAAVVL